MRKSQINLYNADCMEGMKEFPDNYFHLAIVDPPYGIKISKKTSFGQRSNSHFTTYKSKNWDSNKPDKAYFDELRRVSKNQIIFGGNYFTSYLEETKSWCIWDKVIGDNDFSMFEMIYFSFKIVPKIFKYPVAKTRNTISNQRDAVKKTRIHPTQKPVALYIWLLQNYTKSNKERILDTHLGSGSIAIAADKLGFHLWGYELDKDYYEGAVNRLSEHRKQLRLF